MATTNAKLYNRMDTLQNWLASQVMLQPKEAAYIEGSNTFVVNNTNEPKLFSDLYGLNTADAGKTSACYVCAYVTPTAAANNGSTTLRKRITGGYSDVGSWTANQSGNTQVDLPNFVADATVDFPKSKVNSFIDVAFKSPGTPVQDLMPNCMPIDLIVVALREIFNMLGTMRIERYNDGTGQWDKVEIDTLDLAQKGLQSAMELLPYKSNA